MYCIFHGELRLQHGQLSPSTRGASLHVRKLGPANSNTVDMCTVPTAIDLFWNCLVYGYGASI